MYLGQRKANNPLYQLAQINVARMVGINIDDPIMKEFADNLDKVNGLAEMSEGFVWRLKDDTNNASNFNPYHDEQVIINLSVWRDVESLEHFTYKTLHTDFLKRRKEWFQKHGEVHHAMWWIREREYPRVEQSIARLKFIQKNGSTSKAFNFKEPYPMPQK